MPRSCWRGLALVALAVLLGASGVGCGTSPSTSRAGGSASGAGRSLVVIHAANGTIRVPQRPDAIISLSPTATEMLYAIGAGGQVKAVDSVSDYPAQSPRTRLSGFDPNVEAIAAMRPDLVLNESNVGGLSARLSALHIPVLVLPPATKLADVYQQLDEIGAATGHLRQAERESASIRAQIAKIAASAPKRPQPLTYYYELEPDYYSVTSSTFVGQLLSLLGLKSIADAAPGAVSAGGYPQLSAEYIIKSNPDYIFLADTICCHQDAATVAGRPGWANLGAVKAGHVVRLNDDIASRWGPRIVDLLHAVEQAVSGHG